MNLNSTSLLFSALREKKRIKSVLDNTTLIPIWLRQEEFLGLSLKQKSSKKLKQTSILGLVLIRPQQLVLFTTISQLRISPVKRWGQWTKEKVQLLMQCWSKRNKLQIRQRVDFSLKKLLLQHTLILMKRANMSTSKKQLQVQDHISRYPKFLGKEQEKQPLALVIVKGLKQPQWLSHQLPILVLEAMMLALNLGKSQRPRKLFRKLKIWGVLQLSTKTSKFLDQAHTSQEIPWRTDSSIKSKGDIEGNSDQPKLEASSQNKMKSQALQATTLK